MYQVRVAKVRSKFLFVFEQPETIVSQVTWPSSAEYLYTLFALTLSVCKVSPRTRLVQKVLRIIQQPNIDIGLFTEQGKSLQNCPKSAYAIVKARKNGKMGA